MLPRKVLYAVFGSILTSCCGLQMAIAAENSNSHANLEKAILDGHDGAARSIIEPARLGDIIAHDTDRTQRFEQVADLFAVRCPRCKRRYYFSSSINRVLSERIEQAPHVASLDLAPMRAAPSPPAVAPVAQFRHSTIMQAVAVHELASHLHRHRRWRQDERTAVVTRFSFPAPAPAPAAARALL